MNLTIHTDLTAPADSRQLLDGIRTDLGLVPNMAAVIATSPALLAGFDGLRRAVAAGVLDPVDRELVGLTVGVSVDNAYGVAFHSTVLALLGVDDERIDVVRAGGTLAEARLAALQELTRALVLGRGKVGDATIADATGAGLSTVEILEIVAECTFAGLVGTVDNLAGGVELDDFLVPRAWHGTEVAAGRPSG